MSSSTSALELIPALTEREKPGSRPKLRLLISPDFPVKPEKSSDQNPILSDLSRALGQTVVDCRAHNAEIITPSSNDGSVYSHVPAMVVGLVVENFDCQRQRTVYTGSELLIDDHNRPLPEALIYQLGQQAILKPTITEYRGSDMFLG